MQTFLIHPTFESTRLLDPKRHGKQRVEARTIYRILTGVVDGGGWKKHPAVLMWRGYEDALALYYNMTLSSWIAKRYENNMDYLPIVGRRVEFPHWLGDKRLHSSHRAALLRKNHRFYRAYCWKEEPEINYYWPEGKS